MHEQNQQFELAVQFVNQTNRHLFLTGKAGTGKTTFLKYIKENSPKKLAVVAPTGVAAINAGGVTLHSLFQLPFGAYVPGQEKEDELLSGQFFNRSRLLKQLKLNSAKREILRELELLIIDEVSMVRADLLDAVDAVLRYVRRQPRLPFGGVQMLFIGDLFQLPPVLGEEDWSVLKHYYTGPFFFSAHALQESPLLFLELKKIYRQSDAAFIDLLNKLRNNEIKKEDLQLLEKYYRPDFKPESKGEYIILTTHNTKADRINQEELKKLPAKLHTFEADMEGDFNEKSVPAEKKLELKEGAQVMFIRNDKGDQRRYYNGKTATVKRIKGEHIWVVFPDEAEELLVEKESWKNLRYKYNKEADELEEEIKGTFTQFPLRLAWAITIHKSQGLTFSKAIIDAGDSFAPGQVYVALSRLSSLEGLVLHSPILPESIRTDEKAVALSQTAPEEHVLQEQLKEARQQYVHNLLVQGFNWQKLLASVEKWKESLETKRIPLLEEARALAHALYHRLTEQHKVAEKFTRQLEHMLPHALHESYQPIHQRVEAAENFFGNGLENDFLLPLQAHLEKIKKQPKKAKSYLKEIRALLVDFQAKKAQLEQMVRTTQGLMQGTDPAELLEQMKNHRLKIFKTKQEEDSTKKKAPKGESQRISLQLFREGKSVEEIAAERELVPGTIEGHLASFIPTGEIKIEELVPKEKISAILEVMNSSSSEEELGSSQIKEKLGDEYSYGEIKAVQQHLKWEAAEK